MNKEQLNNMLDSVNQHLEGVGSKSRIRLTHHTSKYHVCQGREDNLYTIERVIRGGLTKQEAYDMLYAMREMIYISYIK